VGDDARVKGLAAIVPLSGARQVDIHTHVRGCGLRGWTDLRGRSVAVRPRARLYAFHWKVVSGCECGKDQRWCAKLCKRLRQKLYPIHQAGLSSRSASMDLSLVAMLLILRMFSLMPCPPLVYFSVTSCFSSLIAYIFEEPVNWLFIFSSTPLWSHTLQLSPQWPA
jgi:hypothetical protein